MRRVSEEGEEGVLCVCLAEGKKINAMRTQTGGDACVKNTHTFIYERGGE